MKKAALLFFIIISSIKIYSQEVKGFVSGNFGGTEDALVGASVHWLGTSNGTICDDKGEFSIKTNDKTNKLVVSFIGFNSDTITVDLKNPKKRLAIKLNESADVLEDVTITARQRGNYVAVNAIDKKEIVSFAGLCKMACCNLAESFENSAAVTVGYSDAISGARQIKMLGLAGVYTQILDENRPIMRGLSSTYGLSYTPGMWLSGIQISKGVSSVINGSEAMAGQINLEHRKPTDEERLFVNAYLGEDLRTELNLTSALKVNDKLSTVILTHASIDPLRRDHNGDGFLDLPTAKQANVANRWLYTADNGVQLRFGVKALYEDRLSGQTGFKPSEHKRTTQVYGSEMVNKLANAYVKLGIPVGEPKIDDEGTSAEQSNFAMILDYNYYSQNSYFGIKDYNGQEQHIWANFMYNHVFDASNKLIFGLSSNVSLKDEKLYDKWVINSQIFNSNLDLSQNDFQGGAFAEYSFKHREKFDFILGARADYSSIYNWFFTPRGHIRWAITPRTTFRASGGGGFRTSNLITDNIGSLATGREIKISENLNRQEQSYTYGASITQTFRLGSDNDASISFDFFRTDFIKQVVVDQEMQSAAINIYNLDGRSYSNTFQLDFNWKAFTGFDLFATFRYTDAKIDLSRQDGQTIRVDKPLIDNFKTLINLQYATKFNRWVFDVTAQLNGRSRLPNQNGTLETFEYSPIYPMFFAQITHKIRKIDIYLGCENIANYRQKDIIISPENPFSTDFNSSVIWGPIMGRKIYAGVRYNLY